MSSNSGYRHPYPFAADHSSFATTPSGGEVIDLSALMPGLRAQRRRGAMASTRTRPRECRATITTISVTFDDGTIPERAERRRESNVEFADENASNRSEF